MMSRLGRQRSGLYAPHSPRLQFPMASRLFLLFFLVPLGEIWLLLQISDMVGPWPTIGLCVLTAVIGSSLVRQQGLETIRRVQLASAQGRVPATELLEGMILMISGALLLTPGIFTDVIGFVTLHPSTRKKLAQKLVAGMLEQRPDLKPSPGQVIEGEFERRD